MTRYGMVIDLKKCVGCQTCTLACKAANYTRPGVSWNLVIDEEVGTYPMVSRRFIPRPCMHCQNAPCVEVCPTKASYQREDGVVLVDYEKCVGCKACILACPYGARYFNHDKKGYFGSVLMPNEQVGYAKHKLGVAEKCTFCVDRVEKGEQPACVRACPAKARYFGDLNDASSEVSSLITSKRAFQLLKRLGTEPSVYYIAP